MPIERLQLRRGTGTDWATYNPVLADGEPGYDKTTGWVKYGNGVNTWQDLPWANVGPEGEQGPAGVADDASMAAVAGNPASAFRGELSATYGLKPDNGNRAIGKGELVINVKDYGAVGDGVANDTAALQSAGNAAIAANIPLLIPNGVYKATAAIVYDGSISIQGTGTISSSHVVGPTVQIKNATKGYVLDVKFAGTAAVRDAVNRNLQIKDCSNMTIMGVETYGGGSTGIFIEGGNRISVTDSIVHDTLADGIHVTKGAASVSVSGNKVYSTGDDGIAVVSYLADGAPCTDVTIQGNTVKGGKARGITVAGGIRIGITGNSINGTSASGIIIVEDTTYSTYTPTDVTVTANPITDAGQTLPRIGNGFGIEVANGASRVTLTGNTVHNSYNKGISVTSPGVNIIGNTVSLAGDAGINIGASKTTVVGNKVYDSAKTGIVTAAAGLADINVSHNTVVDSNTTSTAGLDGINIGASGVVTNVTIIGNNVSDGPIRTERAIEVNANGGSLTDNIATGQTLINVVGGSGIERGPLSAASVPTNTFYKTGTTHLNTATNTLYVYNGTAWKSVALV